jgi:plasmid stability protein
MAQLIVRGLDEDIVQALKRRAVEHGRSAEAEHREILREVLTGGEGRDPFIDFLQTMPDVGDDEDFARQKDLPREVKL